MFARLLSGVFANEIQDYIAASGGQRGSTVKKIYVLTNAWHTGAVKGVQSSHACIGLARKTKSAIAHMPIIMLETSKSQPQDDLETLCALARIAKIKFYSMVEEVKCNGGEATAVALLVHTEDPDFCTMQHDKFKVLGCRLPSNVRQSFYKKLFSFKLAS